MPKSIGWARLNSSAYCSWYRPAESAVGPGVMAEREQAPFLWTVIRQRNSGIVLDDGGAVGEQKIAHGGEIAGVQQIGGALDQAVPRRQRLAKLQEARGLDAGIGEIGREVVQRALHA